MEACVTNLFIFVMSSYTGTSFNMPDLIHFFVDITPNEFTPPSPPSPCLRGEGGQAVRLLRLPHPGEPGSAPGWDRLPAPHREELPHQDIHIWADFFFKQFFDRMTQHQPIYPYGPAAESKTQRGEVWSCFVVSRWLWAPGHIWTDSFVYYNDCDSSGVWCVYLRWVSPWWRGLVLFTVLVPGNNVIEYMWHPGGGEGEQTANQRTGATEAYRSGRAWNRRINTAERVGSSSLRTSL